MKKILLLTVILVLSIFMVACGKNKEKIVQDNGKFHIYTTVYPLQYFAERIGGEAVEVASIYPTGANEHTFEPTQKDMMVLADADLFFYIGLGLEGFVENAQKTLAKEHVKMIPTIDSVPDELLEASSHSHEEEIDEDGHEGHDHGDVDTHVWISPKISQNLAQSIKDSLVEAAPEQSETFEKNYTQLITELEQLDEEYATMAHNTANKTFFVSHAAFGYIANTYGLEQVAIAGLNSQDEPSQKELTKIIDLAKNKKVEYILFEQNVSSKLTEVIQKEVGAQSLVLHNLGVLSEEDKKNKETYFTLMERNKETLEKALH